jgi:hypothetical protein
LAGGPRGACRTAFRTSLCGYVAPASIFLPPPHPTLAPNPNPATSSATSPPPAVRPGARTGLPRRGAWDCARKALPDMPSRSVRVPPRDACDVAAFLEWLVVLHVVHVARIKIRLEDRAHTPARIKAQTAARFLCGKRLNCVSVRLQHVLHWLVQCTSRRPNLYAPCFLPAA